MTSGHRNIPSIEVTNASPTTTIPHHVRPVSSRQLSSSSSIRSNGSSGSRRPHRQQQEYVPSAIATSVYAGGDPSIVNGIEERWQFEQAEEAAEIEAQSEEERSDNEEVEDEDDWDNLREDESRSDRPAWRRASPNWIYFFITGATLSMGMGMAPRSELYINLACLAHPPQQPRNVNIDNITWSVSSQLHINSSLPIPQTPYDPNSGALDPTLGPLSPADEWFLKLQREIYEHRHHVFVPPPSNPSEPSKPIPMPSDGQIPVEVPPMDDDPNNSTTHDSPYHAIDPRLCKKDPKVQGAAARLTMIISLTSGVLAALTTGYWGQKSDKLGRKKVMAVVEVGLFLSELCFVLVATFPYYTPGGYRALLIGPALDGLCGGFSTITATVSAYISDTTPDGSRATVFARLSGVLMTGFAIGPVLGSAVIAATGNIMVPFYINVCVHLTYLSLIILVLPESLSKNARKILQKTALAAKDAAKQREQAERDWEGTTPLQERDDPLSNANASGFSLGARETHSKRRKRITGNVKRFLKRSFAFLAPLTIFAPKENEEGKKDWNLTFVGSAMFISGMLYGILQTKTQFALYAYGWTSRELGPYMSLAGFSRAFVLLVAVPVIMRYVKPHFKPTPIYSHSQNNTIPEGSSSNSQQSNENTPLLSDPVPPYTEDEGNSINQMTNTHLPALLDLYTIRVSIILEIIPYTFMALNPTATQFVILSALVTFGAAGGPTANSLALSLIPSSREAGRLFGALGVLQALGSTIISPLMFGTLFSATVGWYAPTIFILAVGLMFIALTLFFCVRVTPNKVDEERGRNKKVKFPRGTT